MMVIYSHLKYCDEGIMKFFHPIFLTTFFFVSGYLFKDNQKFMFVFENRTRTLFLPFLILGGIIIVLSQIFSFNEHIPLIESIKGLLFQNGHNQLLWFIAALYVYSLLFYFIAKLSGNVDRLLAVGLILFAFNVAYSYWLKMPGIPWHFDSVGFGCFYMALGKWYKHHEVEIDKRVNKSLVLVLSIVYIAVLQFTELRANWTGSFYIVDSLFLTMLGLIIIVGISKSKYLNNNHFMLFVGSNTLFYFAMHGKVYSLLQTIVSKVTPNYLIGENRYYDFLIGGGIAIATALVLIIPAKFIDKYCPQILGKGFKLWKVNKG